MGFHHDHATAYHQWAGNNAGIPANPELCAEAVHKAGDMVSSQCGRKRGYGPEGAFCKQHSPEAKAKRDQAAHDRMVENQNKWRLQRYSRDFLMVLERIADGHNDPREIARQIVDEYKQGLRK